MIDIVRMAAVGLMWGMSFASGNRFMIGWIIGITIGAIVISFENHAQSQSTKQERISNER